jgi:hypothetical protein
MKHIIPILLIACAGSGDAEPTDDTDTTPAGSGTGRLAIRFTIDEDWKAAMQEPAVGRFWGDIYNADDVTGIGPNEGSTPYESVYVDVVDLTADLGPTEVLYTSGPLPIGYASVLGFMDSDANASDGAPGPDAKDPVTLPNENEFEVLEDVTTEIDVFLGFLNP